jgi:uncharacterized membrane protein
MPETITKVDDRQIIGGVFSNRENADKAVQDLLELGVLQQDIQVVFMLDNKAEYNPDGSRNLRQDVVGMTAGAAIGAIAGGVAGTVVAGPLGGAAGAAAGAVVGGGAGAAAGKASEHRK